MSGSGFALPSRSLVSQQDSAVTARPDVPRSRFVGSWSHKTTFGAGLLVPFLVDEVLPGDTLQYNVTAYVRLSTPLFPLFSDQRVDTFFFFVPSRLVWDNWRKFMGEQADPTSSIAFTVPVVRCPAGGFDAHGVGDHFGLPTVGQLAGGVQIDVNALPFRAYYLIYNEWFRDENLISSVVVNRNDGPDQSNYLLVRRAKSHDYFTSCLPWPQKFVAPVIPLSGTAPVRGIGVIPGTTSAAASFEDVNSGAFTLFPSPYRSDTPNVIGFNSGSVFADLSSTTGVSINVFRDAFLVQQLLERDARGGTRYTELIRSHFGVTSPDARLQRPEYIGGGSTPLSITPIAQTAPTTGLTVGALGAAGTASGTHSASVAATEHGYVIGLINVKSELLYQQGIHKMWSRSTRFDVYWPSLAGVGEQAVLRRELYANGQSANDTAVFGYQERWHEYRTRTSEATGFFRSTIPTGTLDMWHLGQRFTSAPVLGQTFIEDSPPMDRVLAAGSLAVNQQYLADILISRVAVRPIPTFGTPVTLGRF